MSTNNTPHRPANGGNGSIQRNSAVAFYPAASQNASVGSFERIGSHAAAVIWTARALMLAKGDRHG